ncbi:MAG: hypothetical protein J3K34DRAFT_434543 [Monoraphidium minutum]|nr:MAG: hypothetical protein J3K34DRAFT_434543 [Monoraphidium minutum]
MTKGCLLAACGVRRAARARAYEAAPSSNGRCRVSGHTETNGGPWQAAAWPACPLGKRLFGCGRFLYCFALLLLGRDLAPIGARSGVMRGEGNGRGHEAAFPRFALRPPHARGEGGRFTPKCVAPARRRVVLQDCVSGLANRPLFKGRVELKLPRAATPGC